MRFGWRPTDTGVPIFKGTVGDVFPDQLPLARSAVDRDAISRQDPELITRMLTSPVCRFLLVAGARVAVESTQPTPGLLLVPGNNFPADSLPATSAQMAYLGADSDHPYLVVDAGAHSDDRSEEHTSELQSRGHLVCRLLLEKKNTTTLY